MDGWQAAQSWALLGVAVAGLAYYYAPKQNAANRPREQAPTAEASKKRKEIRTKPAKPQPAVVSTPKLAEEPPTQASNEAAKKRKGKKQGSQPEKSYAAAVEQPEPEDDDAIDMSTRHFAEQMAKAREGHKIGASTKGSGQRVKTVKQGSAMTGPAFSSEASQAGAEEDLSSKKAGDVSDMLEAAAPAPSTLRIVASDKPKKEKTVHKPKEEVVETKKQRQNRKKVEERKLQREQEEQERKVLQEKQRRVARESRGEPAKNGIPAAKAPANNAWSEQTSASAPAVNGSSQGALLDTFDAESIGSSNGGIGASTAATSTSDGAASHWEEEQLAQAMRESEDESGWTTVAVPKKQQKKANESAGDSTPVAQPVSKPKTAAPVVKPSSNSKPNGFQALDDHYQQRTDVDPNDASNWDP